MRLDPILEAWWNGAFFDGIVLQALSEMAATQGWWPTDPSLSFDESRNNIQQALDTAVGGNPEEPSTFTLSSAYIAALSAGREVIAALPEALENPDSIPSRLGSLLPPTWSPTAHRAAVLTLLTAEGLQLTRLQDAVDAGDEGPQLPLPSVQPEFQTQLVVARTHYSLLMSALASGAVRADAKAPSPVPEAWSLPRSDLAALRTLSHAERFYVVALAFPRDWIFSEGDPQGSGASPQAGGGDSLFDALEEVAWEQPGAVAPEAALSPPSPASDAASPAPAAPQESDPEVNTDLGVGESGDWPPEGMTPVWQEEFSGPTLNQGWWSYDLGTGPAGLPHWGNNEQQAYAASAANVRIVNGTLAITARRESADGAAFTSARVTTEGRLAFGPGVTVANGAAAQRVRVEARIQLPHPAGQGLWPAFWMLPEKSVYGAWPASGEIDIMEAANSFDFVGQGVHFGDPVPNDGQIYGHAENGQVSSLPRAWDDGFHVYSVEWGPDALVFFIDGQRHLVAQPRGQAAEGFFVPGATQDTPLDAPFDQPFHVIFNLAVGGNWPGPADGSTPLPATMFVDWVRVCAA